MFDTEVGVFITVIVIVTEVSTVGRLPHDHDVRVHVMWSLLRVNKWHCLTVEFGCRLSKDIGKEVRLK